MNLSVLIFKKNWKMNILEIKNLHKSYGKIKALNGVSFSIPQGSVYGILGPNGSGKTTLLSIILNVLNADSGEYFWMGKQPTSDLRKGIGSLLETPNFYHYLSAVSNLQVVQSISGRGNKNDIDTVLEQVKLTERKNSRFSTYSLGMKQRLAIASALLGNPKVIVLDEPTNGLDPVGIAEIRELIKLLSTKGHTIIMASHLLDEVEKVCTHVAILKTGNLITCGTVDEVLVDEDVVEIAAENNEALFNIIQHFDGLKSIITTSETLQLHFVKGGSSTTSINEFCFKNNIVLKYLSIKRKRLEEKFFELTGN
jgi:ABC-2 type transport system ATP-binding protein